MAKHLVSFDNLSINSIENIFDLADYFLLKLNNRETIDICRNKIMATLFYEASTRTRMSFESAMFRLGGNVISSADTQKTSSAAKGESLADTIKVIQNYADVIVLRHFNDGSTVLAAENSSVPIISGGDGGHEHPTQTLLDLYTIRKEKGRIAGLNVALCGDLRYGRTVHSLAYGLAKFGAKIFAIAPEGLELPEYVKHRIKSEYGIEIKEFVKLDEQLLDKDVLYMTGADETKDIEKKTKKNNKKGKALSDSSDMVTFFQSIQFFDALYVTRIQLERIQDQKILPYSYLVNQELLKKAKDDTIVMHPLPRREELSYDIDQDDRAAYFKQARYGVPVRMALIASLLGLAKFTLEIEDQGEKVVKDKKCSNSNCITANQKYVQNKYVKVNGFQDTYRCVYCDQEQEIKGNEV